MVVKLALIVVVLMESQKAVKMAAWTADCSAVLWVDKMGPKWAVSMAAHWVLLLVVYLACVTVLM